MMKKIIILMVIMLMSSVFVSAAYGGQYHKADDILWSETNGGGNYGSFTGDTLEGSNTYFFPVALSFGGSLFIGADIYVYGYAKTSKVGVGDSGWQQGLTGVLNSDGIQVTFNKGLITGLSSDTDCTDDSDCADAECISPLSGNQKAYSILQGAETCVGGKCVASPFSSVCTFGCQEVGGGDDICNSYPTDCASYCGTNKPSATYSALSQSRSCTSGQTTFNRYMGVDAAGECIYSGICCAYNCNDNSGCLPEGISADMAQQESTL